MCTVLATAQWWVIALNKVIIEPGTPARVTGGNSKLSLYITARDVCTLSVWSYL